LIASQLDSMLGLQGFTLDSAAYNRQAPLQSAAQLHSKILGFRVQGSEQSSLLFIFSAVSVFPFSAGSEAAEPTKATQASMHPPQTTQVPEEAATAELAAVAT
jgi:hypothetical protein